MKKEQIAFPTLEILAAFVHGGVAFGNVLGVGYNVVRKNWKWAAVHAVGVALHVRATLDHAEEVKRDLQ